MFHPHTKNDLVYLTSDVLENNAITHGFSTRKGGVSPTPWDSPVSYTHLDVYKRQPP